jgi:hypothetical protein
MVKRRAAAWLLSLAAPWALANPTPVDSFFKPEALHEARLSPSGKRMALSVPALSGRVGVFVVDLQGSEFTATRAIVFNDGDVPDFQWVDDERLVFSVTDLKAGLGQAYKEAPARAATHGSRAGS